MPVLSSDDHRVLGVITSSDLVNVYDKEVQEILKTKKNLNPAGPVGRMFNAASNMGCVPAAVSQGEPKLSA
jgi:hypothetical protein